MKKIFLFCLTALALTGCGSDDDNKQVATEKILGSWQLSASVENGTAQTLTPCDKRSTISFVEAQKSFIVNDYYDNGSNCEVDTFNGTWEKVSDNAYIFKPVGEAEQTFEVTFGTNTLTLKYNDGSATDPYYNVSTYNKI